MRRLTVLALLASACGVTGQTQKGREVDLRAEDDEEAAAVRRRTLADPRDLEPFLVQYAGTDAARRELVAHQLDVQEAEGCAAAVAFLERMQQEILSERGKPLRIEATVRRAELLLKECRDDQRAVDAGREAVREAVDTQWEDDAQWVLGRACEQAGKLDEALVAYDWIVRTKSSAIPFGSNDSLFLDDAWLAKGLLLEKLQRYDEARDTLRDLIDARDTHLRSKAEEALKRMGK